MSETLGQSPERQAESIDTTSESEKNLRRLQEAARQTPETTVDDIEASLNKANDAAISGKEMSVGERESGVGQAPNLQKELKAASYQRSIKRIQSSLSKTDRTFSKIVHQPVVDNVSNAAGKTIARPSGILGGSVFALSGSLLLLYLSRHYGFSYNYLVFTLLFLTGFVLGIAVEAIVRLIRRK